VGFVDGGAVVRVCGRACTRENDSVEEYRKQTRPMVWVTELPSHQ